MNNSDRLTPVQGPSAVACMIVTSLSQEATGRLSHATGQQQTTTQGDNRKQKDTNRRDKTHRRGHQRRTKTRRRKDTQKGRIKLQKQ